MQVPEELLIDVTEAAGIGAPARTAATVWMPDEIAAPPVVCFAFPGGGYCRRYFSFDMPGDTGGGQAGYHRDRGWVFVAVDHLGFGDSTIPDGDGLSYEQVAAANKATVDAVVDRLGLTGAMRIGIGQSMGGCFTIVGQGQLHTFDAVGILGFSAFQTVVPPRPGTPPIPLPWVLRGTTRILNADALSGAGWTGPGNPLEWGFHWDEEPAEVVRADMDWAPGQPLPPWKSATIPACALQMVTPGTVAAEAALIDAPILLATGERDVVPDPWLEPKAYRHATDITVFVCPRMAHMHNFAPTRRLFWERIHEWGTAVAALGRPAATGR